jgi:hypothetical protein
MEEQAALTLPCSPDGRNVQLNAIRLTDGPSSCFLPL